jgi:Zn-dependent protease with chaperone function
MNFFEYQEHAHKATRWLLFLFLIAVLAIIGITDLFFLLVFSVLGDEQYANMQAVPASFHFTIAFTVIFVVACASFYRLFSLRSGGRQIAEEMGARLIIPSTINNDEKRLINVVEEMAIASGFPVPQVYVLDDSSMNAFAAGYTPHDAIVAVTKGTLESLNRDELQGVIAHEFSHILNGDMRLNLRLIGILFGISFIGLGGRKIVRVLVKAEDGIKLIPVGLGMVAIGYGGLFFGNLIKATISRQREYLADASAVQFTRNPIGIGNALKKIGGSIYGTYLISPQAEEYSHLYFMEGVAAPFFGLMNTHPPLEDRIRRMEPSWDGRFIKATIKQEAKQERKDSVPFEHPAAMITAAAMMEAIMTIGMPTVNHVKYARKLIDEIPPPLLEATREPLSAYALVLGLMMQSSMLRNISAQDEVLVGVDKGVRQALRRVLGLLMSLEIKYRLPLIELAILPLKSLSANQLKTFNQNISAIIHYDGYVEVWEWALHYWIATLSLGKPEIPKPIYGNFSQLTFECSVLLSALGYARSTGTEVDKQAYAEAGAELGISLVVIKESELNSDLLIHAVGKMRNLKPLTKPIFLKALCLIAQHDGLVEPKEVELIRTIAEGIDCPMPPVLDGQPTPL